MSKFLGWSYLTYNWQYYLLRPWEFVRDLYKDIRAIYQRGTRGWADCDTWSLDYSLSLWMPDALRFLKKNKHGIPAYFIDGEGQKAFKEGEKKWDKTIDKMIKAFEISADEDYPKLPKNYDKLTKSQQHAWWKKTHADQDAREKIRLEGMELFGKHFNALWD